MGWLAGGFRSGARGDCRRGRPTVKQMSEASAEALHNTPAISRSSYIHPAIMALAGNDHPLIESGNEPLRGLRAEENRLLDFLKSEIEE
jgi:DNA topoisomerase-1